MTFYEAVTIKSRTDHIARAYGTRSVTKITTPILYSKAHEAKCQIGNYSLAWFPGSPPLSYTGSKVIRYVARGAEEGEPGKEANYSGF